MSAAHGSRERGAGQKTRTSGGSHQERAGGRWPQSVSQGQSGKRGSPFKWLVIVAIFIVAVAWAEAYRKDVPYAVTAWERVAFQFENVRPQGSALGESKLDGEGKLDRRGIESWVIEFTNEERENEGLEPFQHDPAISGIARSHSETMALTGVFSHSIGGKDATDRAIDAGYNCRAYHGDGSYSYGLSENIASRPRVSLWKGLGSRWWPEEYVADSKAMARLLVEQWMNSPGHRQNILDRQARKIGVGVAVTEEVKYGNISETVYGTQNFSACEATE